MGERAPTYEVEGTEPCQDCGGFNGLVWHAPQPLWDELVGRHSGLLCPWCFEKRSERAGIWLTWTPMVASRNQVRNSNWWSNETRDWLLMGQPDPEFPGRSEHPVWAVVRDALEAAGYPQPPMDYYPPENFALPSRSNADAGYYKMDRLARQRVSGGSRRIVHDVANHDEAYETCQQGTCPILRDGGGGEA